jgi:hypothetical protein
VIVLVKLTKPPGADFLRLSRSAIDDTISQNLNALVTPSRAGFDPSSTSQRSPPSPHRQIDPQSCSTFKDRVLFPAWHARSEVLSYCALVATSPDPDDPTAAVREAEAEKNRERVVDERLDPYSARFTITQSRAERLASLVRMERGVEDVVRTKTWNSVRERCGEGVEEWEAALHGWRSGR